MPKVKSAPVTIPTAVENLVRRLSSAEERLEKLKSIKDSIRDSLFNLIKASGSKDLTTIYGTLVIREKKVYNYSGFEQVEAAEEALQVAKAALAAAQKAAQATAPYEVTEILAFTRNKAVSARAPKGRIYIRSFFRKAASKRKAF